jgi:mRNA interferase RelE/StbE
LLALTGEAFPADAEALQGEEFSGYYRVDIGEYRIIYDYVEETDTVSVYVIGKRDGDEAYKEFKRKLKSG